MTHDCRTPPGSRNQLHWPLLRTLCKVKKEGIEGARRVTDADEVAEAWADDRLVVVTDEVGEVMCESADKVTDCE